MYTIAQIVITGIVFGVTFTVAAPSFPIIIIAFVPIHLKFSPMIWSKYVLNCKFLLPTKTRWDL